MTEKKKLIRHHTHENVVDDEADDKWHRLNNAYPGNQLRQTFSDQEYTVGVSNWIHDRASCKRMLLDGPASYRQYHFITEDNHTLIHLCISQKYTDVYRNFISLWRRNSYAYIYSSSKGISWWALRKLFITSRNIKSHLADIMSLTRSLEMTSTINILCAVFIRSILNVAEIK